MRKFYTYIIVFFGCFLVVSKTDAQYFKLRGIVYDSTRSFPMASVSVLTTSGKGTSTDLNGQYEIDVKETDSVWFSYLNKPTVKYPVGKIFDASRFDIALHVNVPVLKEVIVKPRNYKMDSIQNRIDYAKAFDWQKPKIKGISSGDLGTAAGFDLEQLIQMFQFRKNKRMAAFQQRLILEEKDKFIDHRFSKALVLRLTGLTGEARDSFMVHCRPPYEFCLLASDYEFQSYIKQCYDAYKLGKTGGWLRKDN